VAARRAVPCPEVPSEVARILGIYLAKRLPGETFTAFAARHPDAELQALFAGAPENSPSGEPPAAEALPTIASLAGKEA
jgi:hypothetical protein